MSLNRKFVGFSLSFALIFLILFCVLIFGYFYLPTYVESTLIPEIAKKAKITNYTCDVRRIGFTGADFGSVRIGTEPNTSLSIDSVQIDYSIKDLYNKKIKRAILIGIELFCEYTGKEFRIRQFDLKTLMEGLQPAKKTTPALSPLSQGIPVDRLEIRNAVLVLNYKGRHFRLPFNLEIFPGKTESQMKDDGILAGILRLYPGGQEIVVESKIDLATNRILLGFDAKDVYLERFANVEKRVQGLGLSGNADIHGEVSLQIKPFKVASASAVCRIRDTEVAYNRLKFRNSQDTRKEQNPLIIKLNRTGENEWRIYGTGVSAITPLPLQFSEINGSLKFSKNGVTASGDFNVAFTSSINGGKTLVILSEPMRMACRYSAKLGKNGKWEFRARNVDPDPPPGALKNVRLRINDAEIVTGLPIFNVSGQVESSGGDSTYSVTVPYVKAVQKYGTLQIDAVSLKGNAHFGNRLKRAHSLATFELKVPDTRLKRDAQNIKIPMALIGGKLWKKRDGGLNFDGVFKFENTSITDSNLKVKMTGIKGILPLKWPMKSTGSKGKYSIKKVQLKNRNLGSVTGTVQQKGMQFVFTGTHISRLLPNLSLDFTGKAGKLSPNTYGAGIHFEIKDYKTPSDIDIGPFISSAKGFKFNGEMGLKGDLVFSSLGVKSTLNANLKNANLILKEKNVAIEKIQASLVLTDLFKMRSAPKQTFRFKNASFGGLNVNGGKIEFQIESAKSFFIEKGRFSWCDGNVYTESMRISPETRDYNLVLFCDRLKLPLILKQLGAVNAEGTGTVNGRLPLHVKDGKVSFRDGFLFSTPGEGGKIQISGTEVLTVGVPPDTPQYVQIELAREALKEYDYDWAKLNLSTEGENVLLRLQLNGKPSRPLPFVYKKKIGGFAKVNTSGKGSIFQGIRLDVNFSVPLDKILHYKDMLDMIK